MDRSTDKVQSQRPTELILKKRQETIDRVQQLVQDSIASKGFEVALFGSAKYGVDTFKSDLDLVVLVRAKSPSLKEVLTPSRTKTSPKDLLQVLDRTSLVSIIPYTFAA